METMVQNDKKKSTMLHGKQLYLFVYLSVVTSSETATDIELDFMSHSEEFIYHT